jgi:hypothetical protein
VPVIVCVVLCAVFCLSAVWCFVWYVYFCVLCLIVVALPPGKNPFAVQLNNNNNNNLQKWKLLIMHHMLFYNVRLNSVLPSTWIETTWGYGLDDRGAGVRFLLEPWFLFPPRRPGRPLGQTNPPIQCVQGALSPGGGGKRPRRKTNPLSAINAYVKNTSKYTSTPPIRLQGVVLSAQGRTATGDLVLQKARHLADRPEELAFRVSNHRPSEGQGSRPKTRLDEVAGRWEVAILSLTGMATSRRCGNKLWRQISFRC